MTRICIIGDSHTGALGIGWRNVRSEYPDVIVKFFAAARGAMRGLKVVDGALVPGNGQLRTKLAATSGGLVKIAGDFDLYVLCGLELTSTPIMQVFRKMAANEIATTGRDSAIAAAAAAARESLAIRTLEKLRQCTRAPVIIIATPFKPVEKIIRKSEGPSVATAFSEACRIVANEHDATFLPQPEETLTETCVATRPQFARAASPDSEGDNAHMNGTFGETVMRQLLSLAQDRGVTSAS